MGLDQAERCEGGERATAEGHAEDDARENVAEEVHAEDDAREGDAEREENEWDFEAGIEIDEDEGDRGSRHRVTGGK